MNDGKPSGIQKPETAFDRVVRLANAFFERLGTDTPPTCEEGRALTYDVMSALVLAKLQARRAEAVVCQEMLDLVVLVSRALIEPTAERVVSREG